MNNINMTGKPPNTTFPIRTKARISRNKINTTKHIPISSNKKTSHRLGLPLPSTQIPLISNNLTPIDGSSKNIAAIKNNIGNSTTIKQKLQKQLKNPNHWKYSLLTNDTDRIGLGTKTIIIRHWTRLHPFQQHK